MILSLRAGIAALLFTPWILSLGGCGCGFDCNNGNNRDEPTLLTLGLSDALPEELKQVVIEIDRITFRRSGAEDVVVEEFTVDGSAGQDSFQIDLLQYRGRNQLVVIKDRAMTRGTYSDILITIIGDDINRSYVQEEDDSLKPLSTPAADLRVPGMTLNTDAQQFTIEFGLAQSLRYRASDDSYLLASDGIRTEDNAVAASLTGRVDTDLFDSVAPCDAKADPEEGNRVYLYRTAALSGQRPGDVFTSGSGTAVPDDVTAPYAVAALARDALTGSWQYAFGYLPADSYTLAFACDTATDDAVEFDNLVIPLPSAQRYELTLAESENAICDLGPSADCNL